MKKKYLKGMSWFLALDECGNHYEYLCILYDRVPTLPQTLSRDLGILRYLWQNIAQRLARIRY